VHDAAARWLARREAGELGIERALDAWLRADARHRIAFEEIAGAWRESSALAASRLGRERKLAKAPVYMRRSTHLAMAGAGLVAVVGLASFGLVRSTSPFGIVAQAEAATYETGLGEIRLIRLDDGSRLVLDTQSRVKVSFTASARRLELTQGRARFHVAPGRRPFAVSAAGIRIVPAGKLFDVSLIDGRPVVAALEGSVELRGARDVSAEAARQTLAQGEKAAPGSGSEPERIAASDIQWVSGMLALDATPLRSALAAINRYNAVQLRLADPRLGELKVTGAFPAREPGRFADAVARMFGLGIVHPDSGTILLGRQPER
jgi:transmembrane sensor